MSDNVRGWGYADIIIIIDMFVALLITSSERVFLPDEKKNLPYVINNVAINACPKIP